MKGICCFLGAYIEYDSNKKISLRSIGPKAIGISKH